MLLEDIRPQVKQEETLYHKDIGFPDNLTMPRGFNPVVRLRYGGHSRQAAFEDRYGILKLPSEVDLRKGETVEVGTVGNVVTKLVMRFPHDDKIDLVMVIQPADGFVRTVWANEKNDQHKTLNRSKYADPKKQGR